MARPSSAPAHACDRAPTAKSRSRLRCAADPPTTSSSPCPEGPESRQLIDTSLVSMMQWTLGAPEPRRHADSRNLGTCHLNNRGVPGKLRACPTFVFSRRPLRQLSPGVQGRTSSRNSLPRSTHRERRQDALGPDGRLIGPAPVAPRNRLSIGSHPTRTSNGLEAPAQARRIATCRGDGRPGEPERGSSRRGRSCRATGER